jgi:hypothetical protein
MINKRKENEVYQFDLMIGNNYLDICIQKCNEIQLQLQALERNFISYF